MTGEATQPHDALFRAVFSQIEHAERWFHEHQVATKIPAVLPIVVHHGPSGWTAAASLGALYDLDTEAHEVLAPNLPALRFLLDDLGRVPMARLEMRPMTDFGRLAWLFLQRVRVTSNLAADRASELRSVPRLLRERSAQQPEPAGARWRAVRHRPRWHPYQPRRRRLGAAG